MKRTVSATLLALLLLPGLALADGGSAPPSVPSTPASEIPRTMSPEEKAALEKKQAEDAYAAAWREVEKAKQEMDEAASLRAKGDEKSVKKADDRTKSAQKRLKKAGEKFESVVAVLPQNADAWQMLGYTRRMTDDLKGSFDAYWKALSIDPEHVGAHEYLGEAWLKAGKLDQAKAELAFLQKKGATREAGILSASIAAWEKANPQATTNAAAAPSPEAKSVTPPDDKK